MTQERSDPNDLSPPLGRNEVLVAYAGGVRAVVEIALVLGEDGADLPTPCPEWNVRGLLTHLWCTARRFHRLLDACLAGAPQPMLIDDDLAALNRADVAAAPQLTVTDFAHQFRENAEQWVARAREVWEAAPFQVGGVSVGEATGIAAFEWHVHAWDLHRAAGGNYYPAHAETLRQSWDRTVPHLGIDLNGDPWRAVLRAAERTLPDASDQIECSASAVEELDAPTWDIGASTFYQSAAWLAAEATTSRAEARAIVASHLGEHVGGLAVFGRWAPDDDPDEPTVVSAARVLGSGPRLRIGGLRGYSADFAVPATTERIDVARELLNTAARIADEERLGPPALVWATEQATLTMLAADRACVPVLLGADVEVVVPPTGFSGFLEALSPKRRREVGREQRRFADSALRVTTQTLSDCWERCGPLLGRLQAKYGNVGPPEYWCGVLESMARRLPNSVVFLVEDSDGAVAFALGYPSGSGFTLRAAGFDYDRLPTDAAAYFNTVIYAPLHHVATQGLDHLHLGRDSFSGKVHRGGRVSLLWAVGRPDDSITIVDAIGHNRTVLAGLADEFVGAQEALEIAARRCGRRGWC